MEGGEAVQVGILDGVLESKPLGEVSCWALCWWID